MTALFKRPSRRDQLPRRRRLEPQESSIIEESRSFVRNRTMSAHRTVAQEDQPSERSRAHQLAMRRRRVGVAFILLLIAMALIGLFLGQFTSRATIVVTHADLQRTLDTTAYTETLDEYYANHPVERLRFSLSRGQLTEFFVSRHPEVASINQTTIWGTGETQFTLSLRRPIAGWEIAGNQYYVDEQGVAFETNYFEAPTVRIIDNSGVALEEGTAITSSRFLSLIGKLVSLAGERGYTVTTATLPLGTTRQVDIKLKGVKPYVKFSIDRGVGEQVEDMDRSLDHLKSKGVSASYIDVRVEGRAFYQ